MTTEQRVFVGNCRELIPTALHFDLLACDPPYSAKVHAKAMSCSASDGLSLGVVARDLGFAYLSYDLRRWIASAAAQVSGWSLIYSDVESASKWRISCEARGAEYVRTIPWVRWSQPQLSGDRPPSGCEMLTVCHRADPKHKPVRKRWFGPGNLTHLSEKSLRGEDKHKAEKPLDQALRLVSAFSLPGQNVLDPTAGAGTFGVACALLDRNFFGVELDLKWADAADLRIRMASVGALSDRDRERAERWIAETVFEAQPIADKGFRTMPDGKTPDKPQYERAVHRLADAARVRAMLSRRVP